MRPPSYVGGVYAKTGIGCPSPQRERRFNPVLLLQRATAEREQQALRERLSHEAPVGCPQSHALGKLLAPRIGGMARKLRVQYPGAIYHLMNRGDRREPIFKDDADRRRWVETLEECCAKTDWQ